jgi:uncharacterized protein with PQ loop repeat|tara:strand:+ start:1149 stop:1412 length:264 start_codon:yes stop_codon:yes gene_type:complete
MDSIGEFFGALMVLSFICCYIPQIIKMIKNKSSKDVSLLMIALTALGYSSGMVYMFCTEFGIWWFLNYGIGLIMCVILTFCWFKYDK